MGYAFTTLINSGGDITATVDILLLRGFLSPARAHGLDRDCRRCAIPGGRYPSGSDLLHVAGAFVLAVVLHTLWDGQDSLIGTAVVAVASLGLLARTAHRAARSEVMPS